MARSTIKSLALLLLLTALYYWNILFTTQFSLLTNPEAGRQVYPWLHFWIASIQHRTLPLWDPYTFSGHAFAGEMQTAAFYPLHLLLALVPLGRNPGVLARLYEYWFVVSHFLGACFMFALVRDFGLRRLAAIVAAISFALGGFLAVSAWPHLFESAIWLPLILLFLLRALRADQMRRALLNAAAGGLALGLAILAGGLHIAIMEAVIVVIAAAFGGLCRSGSRRWTLPALALTAVASVAFCTGAVQLFASLEYGRLALRWIGGAIALPATEKIPYAYLVDRFLPQGLVCFLIPRAQNLGQGEAMPAYLGVFPFLAAVIGIWKCWSRPWVRYFTGLAVAGFCYALGPLSLLHGLGYALVPGLWTAREAERFIFLPYFALAVLAAFGVEALLAEAPGKPSWSGLDRVLVAGLLACAVILAIAAVFGPLALDPMFSLSVLLIGASCGLLLYLTRGHRGPAAKVLIVALVLFDLSAFSSPAVNKIEAAGKGAVEFERLLGMRGAADFLKSRPGPFRVQVLAQPLPNMGDAFEVQTLLGAAVTMVKDYADFRGHANLLNARYIVRPASAPEPGAIYQDSAWKVYENPSAYPRAWIVHQTIVEPSPERLFERLDAPDVDPHRVALLAAALASDLEPPSGTASEQATLTAYEANGMELYVHAESRGLLVLSEAFYPGWRASVNGRPVSIYKVDGALRGIVVPEGDSRVLLDYAPASVLAGGLLTMATLSAALATALLLWWRRRRAS